jgi:uncharacterized membrane protein
MTPLALVSEAARRGALPPDIACPAWLGHPLVAATCKALAAAEWGGDKMPSAPDRIVMAGLAARIITGGIAGFALSKRRDAIVGSALGAAAAVAAAYVTFALRVKGMRRFGQSRTGLVEDALAVGAARLLIPRRPRP